MLMHSKHQIKSHENPRPECLEGVRRSNAADQIRSSRTLARMCYIYIHTHIHRHTLISLSVYNIYIYIYTYTHHFDITLLDEAPPDPLSNPPQEAINGGIFASQSQSTEDLGLRWALGYWVWGLG